MGKFILTTQIRLSKDTSSVWKLIRCKPPLNCWKQQYLIFPVWHNPNILHYIPKNVVERLCELYISNKKTFTSYSLELNWGKKKYHQIHLKRLYYFEINYKCLELILGTSWHHKNIITLSLWRCLVCDIKITPFHSTTQIRIFKDTTSV